VVGSSRIEERAAAEHKTAVEEEGRKRARPETTNQQVVQPHKRIYSLLVGDTCRGVVSCAGAGSLEVCDLGSGSIVEVCSGALGMLFCGNITCTSFNYAITSTLVWTTFKGLR